MRIYPSDDLFLHDCRLSPQFSFDPSEDPSLTTPSISNCRNSHVCLERESGKICLAVRSDPRVRESHVSCTLGHISNLLQIVVHPWILEFFEISPGDEVEVRLLNQVIDYGLTDSLKSEIQLTFLKSHCHIRPSGGFILLGESGSSWPLPTSIEDFRRALPILLKGYTLTSGGVFCLRFLSHSLVGQFFKLFSFIL
jgi:hypothetical protein